uniref:Odorant receptor n=2 Tax=Stomoxys calcitrans TaxID=35570 RepID=A0A1I8P741_STOCA
MYAHWCYTVRSITDIPKIAESVCTAFQTLISVFKMIYYLFIQRRLYVLLNKAQTHEFVRQIEIFHTGFPMCERIKGRVDKILESSWKNINAQLIFYICCCVAIISNYFLMAVIVNIYNSWNGAPPNYEPMLPFPSYYPFWQDKGLSFPYYHIEMFLGTCACYISGICAVSFDGVFIVLCVHAVGLVKVLIMLIENSTAPDVPKERRVEYLRYCIYQYQRVSEYMDELRRIYKHISLSQFMLSMLNWGIVLFQMGVGLVNLMTLIRMLMYISAAGYEIVLYCYNGQRLTTECEKIPYAFFSCEWYNESEEFKQLLGMMILRTSRNFYFQISWFTTMSLPTLMSMIRTSGSYFLLLRNVAE